MAVCVDADAVAARGGCLVAVSRAERTFWGAKPESRGATVSTRGGAQGRAAGGPADGSVRRLRDISSEYWVPSPRESHSASPREC